MVYPGGKNGSGVYQKIINMMPPHEIYIEPFLGGGAIFRVKRPAPLANIAIDKDARCITQLQRINSQDERVIPNYIGLSGDAIDYLLSLRFTQWYRHDTLIYLDPPYPIQTRSSKRKIYDWEMTDDQHITLLEIIKELPCMVIISSYYSDLYAQMLNGWRTYTFSAQTRSGHPATEWLWMNFPEAFELHDYRYLGENFRQREQIKKKQKRWKDKLEKMDSLERFSILSVIQELSFPCSNAKNDDTAGTIIRFDDITR